jgi:hypothetical protein
MRRKTRLKTWLFPIREKPNLAKVGPPESTDGQASGQSIQTPAS